MQPTSVVIPTYQRPGPLLDCVRSLLEGRQRPDEIIVVGREGDGSTREAVDRARDLCAGKTTLRAGWVREPGHLPPVMKGLEMASGEIVVFVDDDVTVTPEWLRHLVAPFSDPAVGVVGGRVVTPSVRRPRLKGRPGCTSWYGKHWGNVGSLDCDFAIEVESVMEGNCAWRRDLLRALEFDPVLNFDDAFMYGLDLCLQARHAGYRVLYTAKALVYHHTAPRPPGFDRNDGKRRSFAYSRNYTYIMLKHLAWWRRPIFLAWWFLVGERGAWGPAALLRDACTGQFPRLREVWSALRGKLAGITLSASGARANA